MPIWMTARNRPGLRLQALDADGAAVALVDELLDAAAPDGDEGDLGGREDPVEQDEDDDQAELEDGAAHEGRLPRRVPTAARAVVGLGRGSGSRAAAARGSGPGRRPRACPPARPW